MLEKEKLNKQISLNSGSLELRAFVLRNYRHGLEENNAISDELYLAIETAIWAMKVLWGFKNPDKLDELEIQEWLQCKCNREEKNSVK